LAIAAIGVVAVVLVVGLVAFRPVIDEGAVEERSAAYGTMDALQQELAERARSRLGFSDDFQINVTQIDFPIGTLIRREPPQVPVSYTACAPASAPPRMSAPSLFPNYTLSSRAAVAFGLDDDVVRAIVDAGAEVGGNRTVDLSFRNIQAEVLADNDIQALAQASACRDALAGGPVLLVRGYIAGERKFKFAAERNSGAQLGLRDFGSLKVTPASGGNAVEVADAGSNRFLQVVSQIGLAAPQAASALTVEKPQVTSGSGRIFVQMDQSDQSGLADRVVGALGGSFRVEPRVERLASNKVPTTPQVRYFNAEDKAKAEAAAAEIRPLYPNVTTLLVGLPAPSGQLEVWMPRAQGAPVTGPSAGEPVVRSQAMRARAATAASLRPGSN
jgi:hypothetical protein